MLRYIHLNPLRAGMVESLEALDQYPWCGHAVVLGNQSLAGQTTAEVLERFGKTPGSARAKYRAFIADGAGRHTLDPEEPEGLRRWLAEQQGREDDLAADERILGGEHYSRALGHDGDFSSPSPPDSIASASGIISGCIWHSTGPSQTANPSDGSD